MFETTYKEVKIGSNYFQIFHSTGSHCTCNDFSRSWRGIKSTSWQNTSIESNNSFLALSLLETKSAANNSSYSKSNTINQYHWYFKVLLHVIQFVKLYDNFLQPLGYTCTLQMPNLKNRVLGHTGLYRSRDKMNNVSLPYNFHKDQKVTSRRTTTFILPMLPMLQDVN